ncbi:hypothetical protein P7H19_12030 [Paenibacillus larvae]|nr:hypothetical protein [Paenibacillus larvae]MDT2236881.1 hypothetical protein [Paenibacillus larvae]
MHREQIGAKQTDEGMWLGSPEKETEADPKRITFDDLLCRFDTESERKKTKTGTRNASAGEDGFVHFFLLY